MGVGSNGFTTTEYEILKILSDGERHLRDELHKCCGPSTVKAVSVHVCNLNKKLPEGEEVVCVTRNRKAYYQHVLHLTRRLENPYDGRT